MSHHHGVGARAFRQPETSEATVSRRIRTKAIAVAGVAGALLIGIPTVLVGVGSPAGAATAPELIPVFPDNLNVFPNRDFVSIDGYSQYAGQMATITVTRAGVGVVGAATGKVSGGDVAFEVNHPGGICWGAGGGPNITPDILPHDVVSISVNGKILGETVVQDVQAFDAIQDGQKLTVNGHIGSDVNPDNIEQRIIEPALRDTIVNKRDVRAVPGDLVAANKGGYSSSLVIDQATHTFVATYFFDDQESADTAANAGLGERAMAWEFTDPAANRQGMTIAENGEPGGPGMGGCPNGPLQSGPPGPTNVVAARVSNDTGVKVNWTPAVAIPGTPPILGYRVTAVADTKSANGEQVELGKTIANPNAASTTIGGLSATEGYDVEVMSYSSTGYTFPAVHAAVSVDSTRPIITAAPAGGTYPVAQQVTLTSTEIGTDIYYTINGPDPIANGQLDAAALPYDGPITISADTTLKFAGFDPSNNVSISTEQVYTITNNPVPAAPVPGASSVGLKAVTLNWSPADPGQAGLAIVGYKVDVFTTAQASTPVSSVTVENVTSATIENLMGDTQYWFTVSAKNDVNSAYGAPSALIGPLTPQGDLVANAGPDQTNVTRNTLVTLSGAGSTSSGATYTWTQINTSLLNPNPNAVTLQNANTKTASFMLPFFAYPQTNQPLTFELTVTVNGIPKADQVVITPHVDAVSVTKSTWKQGDFRVIGIGTAGSTVTARTAGGAPLGSFTVLADGSFDIRNKTGVANPVTVYVDSNMGGTSAGFKVAV